jgi:hypothetical protein
MGHDCEYLLTKNGVVTSRDHMGRAIVKEPIKKALFTQVIWRGRSIAIQHLLVCHHGRLQYEYSRVKIITDDLDGRKFRILKDLVNILKDRENDLIDIH